MKKIFTAISLFLYLIGFSQANSYTQTYTLGTISGVSGVENPGDLSPCPGILTFSNIPAGETIDSTRIEYTFFSTAAGFQSVFDQRSYVKCLSTGLNEPTSALATFSPGFNQPFIYNRLITIANGPVTGPVTFELHAGTVSLIGNSCGGLSHHIYNNSWIVTVYTSGSAVCHSPDSVQVTSITDTTAQVHWTPGGNETSWRLLYGPSGFTPGSGTGYQSVLVSGTPSHTLFGLSALTDYDIYVRALCTADSSFLTSVFQFTTDSAYCPAATGLNAGNITNSSASLSWTANGGENAWHLQYGPSGFTLGSGTMILNANSNPWQLNGLNGGTSYDFYVKSLCGTTSIGDWAGPYSFLTTSIGLDELNSTELFVYPNPTSGQVIIRSAQATELKVYDLLGNDVGTYAIAIGENTINLEHLSKGVYFLQIEKERKALRLLKH
jgi:hypothetical protein